MVSRTDVRRFASVAIALAIFGTRIDRQMVQLPFVNLAPIRAMFTARPDRLWPQFPRFVDGVRARTSNGDSIALLVPTLDWDAGYSYAYYRASYLLAGRKVLPLATADGRLQPANFRSATYVAAWGRPMPPTHMTVVWSGEGGTLLKR